MVLAIVAVSFGPDWIESIGVRTGWWGANTIVSGVVEAINDRAPIQIDDAVVAVGASVEPENTIRVNWQITTWSRDQLDLIETERVIREQYVAPMIANSMDDETAELFERHSIRYQYSVSDRNGDHLFDIFIDEF